MHIDNFLAYNFYSAEQRIYTISVQEILPALNSYDYAPVSHKTLHD